MIADEDLREELRKINSNSRLSELFLSLARDLDVMEAKTPDEVQMSLCTLHPLCTNNVACMNTALAPALAIICLSCIACVLLKWNHLPCLQFELMVSRELLAYAF